MNKRCNRRFTGVVRSLALGATLLPAVLVATPPATAGDNTTCAFDSDSGIVTIEVTQGNQVGVERNGNAIDEINADCGAATRFNTRKIVINDVTGYKVNIFILLQNGPLAPGTPDEPGNSDEIEVVINPGSTDDDLIVRGGDGNDSMVTGIHFTDSFSWDIRVNFNSNETSGVDHDVTAPPGNGISLQGVDGADFLSANGERGTGSPAFGRVYFYGGDGSDVILGGVTSDYVFAENGNDIVRGGNGNDFIYGSGGRDTLKGQERDDTIEGGKGDDTIEGGPGTDDCGGGGGVNTISGCED